MSTEKLLKECMLASSIKESRLSKLYDSYNKLTRIFDNKRLKTPRKYFYDYQWGIDEPFKLSWYDILEPDNKAYVKKNFYKEFPGATWKDISKNIKSDIEIPRNDKLEEGEWLLTFQLNKNYMCIKTGLEWMYIDKKITNAFTKAYYPIGCFELANIKHPSPPFTIDKKFRNLFAQVVNQEKYKQVRNSNYIKNITPHISRILNDIKREYQSSL